MYGTTLRWMAVLAILLASAFTLSACDEAPSGGDQTGSAPDAGMTEGAPATGADGGTGEAVPETAPGSAD